MKVAMQESAVRVHPPLSKIGSSGLPTSADLRSLCQLHVKQLAAQLPVVAVWLVYQDSDSGKRQLVPYYTQEPYGSTSDFSCLQSEVCLTDSLPVLQLSEVNFIGQRKDSGLIAYACLLGEVETQPNYLLLWASEPFCALQQQYVEQHAQMLSHSLAIHQQCSQQRSEIQSFEQGLRQVEHQLRNPLALIALYAENLCLGSPAGMLQEQATIIRDTVTQLSTHLTDLVYYGEQAKLRVAPHDLRAICLESIQNLQPWLEGKQIQINLPETPLVLAVDRWQIKQVFDNLLSNAVAFSPHRGSISCCWQSFRDEVVIEVSDQGSGISEEDLKHIFTPYYSRRLGGTGLGLAIVKKIVLDHQGNIWAQNLPGGGAQFSLTLPKKLKINSVHN